LCQSQFSGQVNRYVKAKLILLATNAFPILDRLRGVEFDGLNAPIDRSEQTSIMIKALSQPYGLIDTRVVVDLNQQGGQLKTTRWSIQEGMVVKR
jgi:hypothetical protein